MNPQFIGRITYKESDKPQKLEVKLNNVFKLLEMISKFDDLDILEVLVYKEAI
jgi:hypothetical protein